MKRLVASIALFSAALALACSEREPSGPSSPSALAASPGDLTAKPPPFTTAIPAQITFSDRPGDAITSDDNGPYVHGGQLEVAFYTDSKDLVMRGNGRSLTLNHLTLISGTGPIGTTVVSNIFMNIHGIFDMEPDTIIPRLTSAAVKRTSTEFFRFNTIYTDATMVSVTRASGVWTVTADSPAGAALVKSKPLGTYDMPFQLTAVCPAPCAP